MYCKYAEYACKLQKNLPMTNKTYHNMQKIAISYHEYVEYAGIRQKKMLMISQKYIIIKKTQKMQYRYPPIQEHLVYSHLICMYMYIYVIYTAHEYVCIMPFSEVTVLFNQHYIIVGKFRRAF